MMNNRLLEISHEIMDKWQSITDAIAKLAGVPSGLIMRIVEDDIQVFVSSITPGNPYKPGDAEKLIGSGLYCEAVINSHQQMLIPNALKDDDWKDNPDIKLGMISYLGFPIINPDGTPFGTICVLDKYENSYNPHYVEILGHMRSIIEADLEMIYINTELGAENRRLTDIINELKALRELLPICAGCKKIRDSQGYWNQVEDYLASYAGIKFTHSLCQECIKKLYGDNFNKLEED